MWNVEKGTCIRTFKENKRISAVCFSPDGKQVLSGSVGGYNSIKLWDVAKGKSIRTFEGFTGAVYSVCFNPDGKTVLSANEQTMTLWDVLTGQCIHSFEHVSPVLSACFSPDGKIALSSCKGMTMNLWDIATRECLFKSAGLVGFDNFEACFSPDGTQVLVAGGAKILIYELDNDLEFPGWQDWDDGALPYSQTFLSLYPNYSDADFDQFITELQIRGYGWLRPEGVKAKLNEMQQTTKKGLFRIFGKKK